MVSDPSTFLGLEAAYPTDPPHDFVDEIPSPKHGVHDQFEIMAHGRIAVEIYAAGRLEDAPHLQQPRRHVDQIGFVAPGHGSGDDPVKGRFLRFDQVKPCDVHVRQRPRVPESGTRRFAPDRRGVVGFRVERRVKVDQVHRPAVHASHDREIVARPDRLVGPVSFHRSVFLRHEGTGVVVRIVVHYAAYPACRGTVVIGIPFRIRAYT